METRLLFFPNVVEKILLQLSYKEKTSLFFSLSPHFPQAHFRNKQVMHLQVFHISIDREKLLSMSGTRVALPERYK